MKYAFIVFAMVAGAINVCQSVGNAREAGAKAAARPKVAKARQAGPPMAVPAGVTLNACGCYRTEAGACFCGDRNGACVCLGDCEPMACEQRRAKEIDREVAVETKKAQDEAKRRQDEVAAAEAAAASQANPAPLPSEDALTDDSDDSSAEKKAGEAKTQKHASASRKRTAAKP
ncbi:MAG TPA: hypothetical protein VFH73_27795 [Polyangia bacterium]|jgi:hypothetical protein|nr:hypothetical protein [Polyangia bacterium]